MAHHRPTRAALRAPLMLVCGAIVCPGHAGPPVKYNVSVLGFPGGKAPAPVCYLGEAIALAPDASLAVVGSYTPSEASAVGVTCKNCEVYVYARNASTGAWHNLDWGKLMEPNALPAQAQMDKFGSSVAVSTVASSILIGAELVNTSAGAVFAFNAIDGKFEQYIAASDGTEYSLFGHAIATAAYAPLAIIAAYGANNGAGEVYMLSFDAQTRSWNVTQTVNSPSLGPGSDSAWFGYAVAMSGSGNFAIIGAIGVNVDAGAAYIFERAPNGTWTLQATLDAPASAEDWFGIAAAMSEDVAAVTVDFGPGAVYVYARTSDGSWILNQTLTLADTTNTTNMDAFGCSVALSLDGRVLVVGACQLFSPPGQGEAFAFTRNASGVWTQLLPMTPQAYPKNAVFGTAVATNEDGSVWMVGAPSTYNDGSTYAYAWEPMSESDE